ncbi:MAG: HNH endonuclease [Planctomycetes bacterium]|nr:HNH endonuclease [Planctomycetota bacterium]
MLVANDLEARVAHLNIDRSGGKRKPHKPLLLLYAIARLVRFQETELEFDRVSAALTPLLAAYAPPVKDKPQPAWPYWYLRSDGVWEVPGAEKLELQDGGFPRMAGLRQTHGKIPEKFARALQADSNLVTKVVRLILDEHFEPSLHEDILAAVGFDRSVLDGAAQREHPKGVGEGDMETIERLRRSGTFRDEVLSAYDRRCALTGFQALISGTLFGVEAAHVQWHSKGGPARVANGIALNPTLHKLLDYGAWSLTDDRRVIVSREFTGSDAAIEILRPHHGKQLRDPLPGCEPVGVDYIRWHREPELGGIFRWPPLAL